MSNRMPPVYRVGYTELRHPRARPRDVMPWYLRLISPQVGSTWMWEPLASYAHKVRVTDLKWTGEAVWVECQAIYDADGQPSYGEPVTKSLEVWVMSAVFVAPPKFAGQQERVCTCEPALPDKDCARHGHECCFHAENTCCVCEFGAPHTQWGSVRRVKRRP